MLSSQRKRHWIKCICSSILLLAAATWITYLLLPSPSKGNKFKNASRLHSSLKGSPTTSYTRPPSYKRRLEGVDSVCDKYSIPYYRIFKRASSNRLKDERRTWCSASHCPVLVDDPHLFYFCFIPKVASTTFKQFFYQVTSTPHNFSAETNPDEFNLEANEVLKRISPNYYPKYVLRRYYKVMFVRHPFDRLVSAFRDKGERAREERMYFYNKYWDPMMKKYRSTETLDGEAKPTFREFARYLIETDPSHYDSHWSFYWSRCEPCLVGYDFIGKLEDMRRDYGQVSRQLHVGFLPPEPKHSLRTKYRSYFYNLTAEEVSKLYSLYKLDFEIFGYSLDEFFGTSNYNQSLKPSQHTV